MIKLALPFPPSVWDIYVGWGKSRRLSPEYAKWRKDCGFFLNRKNEFIDGPFSISVALKRPHIPSMPTDQIDGAVVYANNDQEILKLYIEQQRLTNDLLIAEMNKSESLWTWAWRPAWMWFLMLAWFYALMAAPIVSGMTGVAFAIPDLSVLVSLTITFLALYMGGHTVKDIWGKK